MVHTHEKLTAFKNIKIELDSADFSPHKKLPFSVQIEKGSFVKISYFQLVIVILLLI